MSGRDLINQMRDGGGVPVSRPQRSGLLDLALSAFAFVALAAVAYFGVITYLSPPPQPVPVPVVASIKPVAASWTEADAARCQAKARTAANAPMPMDTALANRSVTEGFAGLSTRLECQLATKPERLCDPEQKAVMVAAVTDYLGRVDLIHLGLGAQGAPMRLLGSVTGGEVAAGSTIYDMTRDDTVNFMNQYQTRVAKALRKLSHDGILTAADFGTLFGTPKSISAMFGDELPAQHICG